MAKRKTKNLQDAPIATDGNPLLEKPSVDLPRKFLIQLDFLPQMEIESNTEQEAISFYNRMTGVIKSDKKHSVTLLG
jgi:hypothetical protein